MIITEFPGIERTVAADADTRTRGTGAGITGFYGTAQITPVPDSSVAVITSLACIEYTVAECG